MLCASTANRPYESGSRQRAASKRAGESDAGSPNNGGGGGSGSLLGATGAQTLAARLTRWAGAAFAVTCVTLSLMTAQSTSSVVDIQPASSPQAQPAMPKPST